MTGSAQKIHNIPEGDQFTALLADYPEVLTPTFSNERVKHNVEHFITTEGPPIHGHRRRLPPEKLNIAREEFRVMEEMASSGARTANGHLLCMFPKSQVNGDLVEIIRRLNNATVPDRYTIPHIQDLSSNLAGSTIFSKVDLVRWISPNSIEQG